MWSGLTTLQVVEHFILSGFSARNRTLLPVCYRPFCFFQQFLEFLFELLFVAPNLPPESSETLSK